MVRADLDHFMLDGEEWTVVSYAPPRPPALAALTGSELAVIELWLAGRSARSIASERGVRERTVANQIANAYAKLRVSSRAELLTLVHGVEEKR